MDGRICRIFCVSANSDSITFSFQFGFIFFSSLIAVTTLSRSMFGQIGKSGHQEILEDMFRVFTFENDVNCGFVVCGLCYVEVDSLRAHFLESFFFLFKIDN